jgi:hypothetical protein
MDGGDTRESPDSSAQSKSPRTLRNFMHGNRETSGASEPETGTDRREKAESRTARMHAPEESDRGVVPKNRSNNEAQAKTEGEEGRPRIKENASPTHTHPTQSGEWVSQGLAGVRQALTPSIRDKSRMREICSYGSVRGCVKNARRRNAVPEMKEDPSEPACRSRLQTAVSCCRPMALVVNVTEKA